MDWARGWWSGDSHPGEEGVVAVHTRDRGPEQRTDPLIDSLAALEHGPPLQPLKHPQPAGQHRAEHDMPALHALISLYQEHFRPQCAQVAAAQKEICKLLTANDRAAAELAASATAAASESAVAARNLELVRGMQEEAEALAARLQRVRRELEQLETAQRQRQEQQRSSGGAGEPAVGPG